LRLIDVWDKLPNLEHTRKYVDDKTGLKTYEVCGKKLQETAKVEYVIPILEKYYSEYGGRAILAAKNMGIDFKAVSHAIRAAMQIREIFLYNDIKFPLKEAEFLREVKSGKLDYNTVVAPRLENLMDEIEELSGKSTLPNKPDYRFWEEWLCFVLEDNLFGSE